MSTKEFGDVAQRLARNPLGIIALFIVLVYGIAALVTGLGGSLSGSERLPLIYFLVFFPVLVLAVFWHLVSKHSSKLFAPSDFQDEGNYVKLLTASAHLGAAAVKHTGSDSEAVDIQSVARSVQSAGQSVAELIDRRHILWVDDHPEYNGNERAAFEALGFRFTLVTSTAQALASLDREGFAAIISDQGRAEGAEAGLDLLGEIRRSGDETPFFIYAADGSDEFRRRVLEHGGQGATNRPDLLFTLVTRGTMGERAAARARR